MFKNLKISRKMFLLVGSVLILIFFNVGIGLWGITQTRQAAIKTENLSELLNRGQEVRLSIQKLIMPANDFLIIGADLNEQKNLSSLLEKANQRYSEFVEYLDTNPSVKIHGTHATEKGELIINDIKQTISNLAAWSLQIFSTENAKESVAVGQLMERIDREADDIVSEITTTIEHIKQDQNQAITTVELTRNNVTAVMILFLVVSFALLGTIQFIIIRSVVGPLQRLSGIAEKIKGGDLTKRAEITSKDEIGQLAQSFNQMVDSVVTRGKEIAKLKDEFVFIATHELRTPATVINGYLEMILEENGKLGKEMKENLLEIEKANKRLLALVNDLLEVARTESGKIKITVSPQNISEIIKSSIQEVRSLALQKKISIRYEPEPKLLQVLGDSQKIKEILINLIGNAIKYNKVNGTIIVSHEPKDSFLITHVSDTGIGLSEEERKHLFEKFWRSEKTEVRQISGTGLGLFITKELVKRMNGTIWVTSEEGKGSTFSFQLPII